VEEVRLPVSGVEGRDPMAVEGRGMFSLAITIPNLQNEREGGKEI
jgi:hypothetical protein